MPWALLATHGERDNRVRVFTDLAQLSIMLVMVVGFLFVLADRPLLPPKFSNDSDKIQEIALGTRVVAEDPGYQRVGEVYGRFGLGDYPALAGALGYGAFCLTMLPTLGARCAGRFTPTTLALTLASVLLGAVYLGTYSKDVFVIPITAIAVAGGRSVRSDVLLLGAMSAYAHYLREYWFIVAAFYIALRLANRSGVKLSRVTFVVIAGIVCLAFAIPAVEGVPINHFRESINAGRAESVEAQTMLRAYLGIGGEVGGILNTCLTLLLLLSPIPLILLGTAYHTMLFGFISVFWGRFLVGLRQYTRDRWNDPRVNRLVLFAIAFVTVQSVFEPDYGSYMRHLTPLLAVVTIALLELEKPEGPVEPRSRGFRAPGWVGTLTGLIAR